MASGANRRSSLVERASAVSNVLYVSDVRQAICREEIIPFDDNITYEQLIERICKKFGISAGDKYVITTTYREQVTADTYGYLEVGDTLYVLTDCEQELESQTREKVNYLPHYDTIVKGGMYEYYASEGQNPLSYAFAELVDNALTATNDNAGPRNIEIRLHLDDDKIFVIDNGHGMTSRQLNNWAVYRLSKFIRRDAPGNFSNGEGSKVPCSLLFNAPRSLNSDISYFGVGGKQAIFFIGTSTTMITKQRGVPDVHELNISRDQFERKEQNKEEIYSGYIRNRKPGDTSHVSADEETLLNLIKEESDRESFTVVMIQGINPVHLPFLKGKFSDWTRQLSHIYHYYIHGPNGNMQRDDLNKTSFHSVDIIPDDWFSKINIEVRMFTRGNKDPVLVNLRDLPDDAQTNYIRSAASTFEFKATVEGTGVAEGVLRYHPFLYDKETFPTDQTPRGGADMEDDPDYMLTDMKPARGKRPIFECFWNGRLIPYTMVDDFDWCSVPKKSKGIPLECFNRVSGVIFTNDKFQVSTNKLTFIDLEVKLRDKQTVFARLTGKIEKRTDISKEFLNWLAECHENLDKQVKFFGFKGKKTRPELPKTRQSPWSLFSKIEWDGKLYEEGTMVRIHRTLPIMYGSINQIWLYGDYDGEVYATGGELEIIQEPRSLYGEVKTVPLIKLDRNATDKQITKYIEDEQKKLPEKLVLTWPHGDEVKNGEKRAAGKPIGDINVEIANYKGEYISRLPGSQQRKLLVELKIICNSGNGEKVLNNHIAQHGKNWSYWFRKMENFNSLGLYTLQLQCILSESDKSSSNIDLPSHKIKFTVTESEPVKFSVGMLDGPFRIGVPFDIPLEFQDEFGNLTKPDNKFHPVLEASELTLKHGDIVAKGTAMLITEICAEGDLGRNAFQGKSFDMKVRVPELDAMQSLKIRMLPGPPNSIHVSPESFSIENGESITMAVEVRDSAGNVTAYPRSNATVKISGAVGTPTYSVDCQRTGQASLTNKQVLIKKVKDEQLIHARVELNSFRSVAAVEVPITVRPSSRAASMTLQYEKNGEVFPIEPNQDLIGPAGESIQNLKFTIEDEAGRNKIIEKSFVSKIKVNWTPKIPADKVIQGQLPDVKIPSNVSESKYCNITLLDGSGLDFSFTVKAVPGPASVIKCLIQGDNKVRLGETMSSDILVIVMDKHGNHIKKLEKDTLADLQVTGEGLVIEEMIRGFGPSSGFNLERIRFDSGNLGPRELHVQWRGLEDFARLEVVPGPPDKLTVENWDISQPLTIYNNGRTPQPLIAQLCDTAGNPTAEEDVKVQLTRESGIRLTPTPQPMKTDKKGQANFGFFVVYGKSGVYEVQPKAFIGRNIISGPKLAISIQLDPTKPVALEVTAKGAKKLNKLSVGAGERLPDMIVSVKSEDESVMTSAKHSCVRMKVMYQDNRPAYSIQPPDAKDSGGPATGIFSFSDRNAPEASGIYNIVFSYVDAVKFNIQSDQIACKVTPGPPELLLPVTDPGTPTVSNTEALHCRTLVQTLQLQLRDKFGNPAGLDLSGKLHVEITQSSANPSSEIPNLAGGAVSYAFVNGSATIENLLIEENTTGRDGQEYILSCSLDGAGLLKKIPPYHLSFLFYNDVKKQSQMAALSKERDNLMGVIRTYQSLFDTTQQLINELKLSVREAKMEEDRLRTELQKTGLSATSLSTLSNIDAAMKDCVRVRDEAKERPRRMCGLAPGPKDPLVLGKIGQLAEIEDDDCARVLSWHMSADMDCLVTMTTSKAQEIHQLTAGRQQVLPLDSIYRKNLPDWNKPLPHVRLRPNWSPSGRPVYARDLLNIPNDIENCRIVFGMLLGDTVILDTLDDANAYRQEIVKFTHCPTILTRDGERIRSNGKFGGLMNKALPIEKLRGAVFGAPLPKVYFTSMNQIDFLQNHRQAFIKRIQAEEELRDQTQTQETPEMKAKHKECEEAQEQLRAIEARLGFSSPMSTSTTLLENTPSSASRKQKKTPATDKSTPETKPPTKRGRASVANSRRDSAPNPSTPNNKRKSRAESPEVPSSDTPPSRSTGTPQSRSTGTPPSRSSTRRAAQESSLAWESLRKRPRRN